MNTLVLPVGSEQKREKKLIEALERLEAWQARGWNKGATLKEIIEPRYFRTYEIFSEAHLTNPTLGFKIVLEDKKNEIRTTAFGPVLVAAIDAALSAFESSEKNGKN